MASILATIVEVALIFAQNWNVSTGAILIRVVRHVFAQEAGTVHHAKSVAYATLVALASLLWIVDGAFAHAVPLASFASVEHSQYVWL